MTWFGADPGGAGRFGVALLQANGSFVSSVVSCADEAIEWLEGNGTAIVAAGIDAPLWWSSGRSGDREVDRYLRKTYKISGGTVQTANSLRGAVLVQGVMLASLLRERLPKVPITESHPKALLKALRIDLAWGSMASRFGIQGDEPKSEHERDAVLGAVAARQGSSTAWTRDLSQIRRSQSEENPENVPWGPVHYWWPRIGEGMEKKE